MKKLLLLIAAFVPLCLFGQIKIGNTEYATLDLAGDAATEDGDTITIAGTVTLATDFVYGFKKDNLVITGVGPDSKIQFGINSRLGFEQGKTITLEKLTLESDTSLSNTTMLYVDNENTHLILNYDTIRGAHSADHGGAMLLGSITLTEVNYCVFENNKSAKNGGCFWMVGESDLKVNGSLFRGNVAQYQSGDGKGGVFATVDQNHEIIVENSAFINNWSEGHSGVYQAESHTNTNTTFVNCTFSGNHSGGQGGVSWYLGGGENLSFINCTMIGNYSGGQGQGGIISLWDQVATPVTISNSVLQGNGYNDGLGNLVVGPCITSNVAREIDVNSSFIGDTITDNVTVNGSNNLSVGDMFLESIAPDNFKYFYGIGLNTSVLNTLGDPALLSVYSTTDQRGWERDMTGTICAGSFERGAVEPDSVIVKWPMQDLVLVGDEMVISYAGVFEMYLNPWLAADVDEVEFSSEAISGVINKATSELTLTREDPSATEAVTVTLTAYGALAYNTDEFVVFLGPLSTSSVNDQNFHIYPNPANQEIQFTNPLNSEVLVQVYTINGTLALSSFVSDEFINLNVSSLNNGMYFIKLTSQNEVSFSHCFIKE